MNVYIALWYINVYNIMLCSAYPLAAAEVYAQRVEGECAADWDAAASNRS